MAATLARRDDLKIALRAVVVKDEEQRDAFDRTFEAFFDVGLGTSTGAVRDAGDGEPISDEELEKLLAAIDAARRAGAASSAPGLSAVAMGGASLDRWLRDAAEAVGVADMRSGMQIGYFTQRVLEAVGADAMRAALPELGARLAEAIPSARAEAIVQALDARLDRLRARARAVVDAELARRNALARDMFRRRLLEEKRFTDLRPDDVRDVERQVRRLAERLRGRLAVRRKRRRRGKLDVRRTLRLAHRTAGIPFRPVTRRRREDRPKLVVLCDVSDSVRFSARFLLILTWAVQEVFRRTRTFAFVSELGETTELFEKHPSSARSTSSMAAPRSASRAAATTARPSASSTRDFGAPSTERPPSSSSGTRRTNYLDPNVPALDRIARRAARVLWLDPEPRASWGFGDSAMDAYLPHVDEALPVSDLRTLRVAVDRLVEPR